MKIVGFNKKQKKSQYAGSLPSATDGNGLFAVCRGRQRSHVAANCASWELTHLVSLPTVADGKDLSRSDVQLMSFGGRKRPDALCRQRRTAKAAVSRLTD